MDAFQVQRIIRVEIFGIGLFTGEESYYNKEDTVRYEKNTCMFMRGKCI